ncbi:HlyD family type I secretion periplasmic adaptor subunit [Desulfuromonas acetoxidans]|uniref:Type I secretion membrane fusion protein, HlyD n=1 Tax=Desulfuromonas acetoxidans (strain DSM 684 / 11070) TaxID=281689 RepID=Q1JZ82_DESA6|nr:HlyD family type I secretion periplasmic adaptor subunit [Desulfuromonas acetoxidans]EAT15685.1 Type I secretion membrane fusion protein, HlyD [Desulfuromonas acetoxidans DSM 684]MBF0645457.1 HlyD family type I secretion periplasmic adaptor subunit [Desulfuromonas acetoxidans]NVD25342.1 HlyD family type I secretion periplasmic adaptor subunit [Desulfuromonas acetoxidans]NVE17394.1 HlyD family type I secretion periplasmic adaptor subunit [Desulfuromonas acetoxidans]
MRLFNKTPQEKQLSDSLEFLGEVDAATYRTGHRFAYLLSLMIFLLMVIFVLWAHFTVLDEVTRGQGQVIPSQRVQIIQHLEGGIIEQILVEENQIIEKGDVLVRIRNTVAASQYRDAANTALEHEAAIARLTAEAENGPLEFSQQIERDHPELVSDQRQIFEARQAQIDLEINVLESQYQQKQQEIRELSSRKKKLQQGLSLAREQLDIATPLVEQELYPRVDYLSLKRDVANMQGDLNVVNLTIPRIRESAREAQRRIDQRRAQYHTEVLNEISKRRMELISLREAISAGEDRVTRTDVRSPVRGTVKQLIVNTVGGVIRPGEPILEVVPLDDALLVEAQIRPADIAFLYPGQPAKIKLTAYDFSIYGGLDGYVEQISADTIVNEHQESFYRVKLRTKEKALTYKGTQLPIIPGMTASVDILTGKKSVLSYLLKPILKAKQTALRER